MQFCRKKLNFGDICRFWLSGIGPVKGLIQSRKKSLFRLLHFEELFVQKNKFLYPKYFHLLASLKDASSICWRCNGKENLELKILSVVFCKVINFVKSLNWYTFLHLQTVCFM